MLEPIPFWGMIEVDLPVKTYAGNKANYIREDMNNEPVAWAYIKDGEFWDAIHPDEHAQEEGSYDIPLYTHPAKEQKCVVQNCENHKHEGSFNGDLCSPCYQFIAHGKGVYSQAYRNTHPVKDINEAIEIIKDFQNSDVPPCKDYENTYADGWMDACNEILWAIEEKAQEK